MNFVKQRAGPIPRDDRLRVVQPFRARRRAKTETEIAAAARDIEREFRFVPAVHAKRRVAAIERPVEKFLAVLDDEIPVVGSVAQRPREVIAEHAAAGIQSPLGRRGLGVGESAQKNSERGDDQNSVAERDRIRGLERGALLLHDEETGTISLILRRGLPAVASHPTSPRSFVAGRGPSRFHQPAHPADMLSFPAGRGAADSVSVADFKSGADAVRTIRPASADAFTSAKQRP